MKREIPCGLAAVPSGPMTESASWSVRAALPVARRGRGEARACSREAEMLPREGSSPGPKCLGVPARRATCFGAGAASRDDDLGPVAGEPPIPAEYPEVFG